MSNREDLGGNGEGSGGRALTFIERVLKMFLFNFYFNKGISVE